jgi:hypothetical protein
MMENINISVFLFIYIYIYIYFLFVKEAVGSYLHIFFTLDFFNPRASASSINLRFRCARLSSMDVFAS